MKLNETQIEKLKKKKQSQGKTTWDMAFEILHVLFIQFVTHLSFE